MAAPLWPAGPIPARNFSFSSFYSSLLRDRSSSGGDGAASAAKKRAASQGSGLAFKDDAQLDILNEWTKDLKAHLRAPASSSSSTASAAPRGAQARAANGAAAAASARAAPAGKPLITPAQKRPRPLAESLTPPPAKRVKTRADLGVGKTAAALASKKAGTANVVKKETALPKPKVKVESKPVAVDPVKPIEEDADGNLPLQATATSQSSQLLSLLKRSRQSLLTTVPISAFRPGASSTSSAASKRPSQDKRCRMPTLESWRNERLVFERKGNSDTPSVSSVVLNCSPKPDGDAAGPALNQLVSFKPPHSDQQSSGSLNVAVEVVGVCTDAVKNSMFNLAPWRPAGRSTMPLPGTDHQGVGKSGVIYVEQGAVRVGWKHGKEGEEVVLEAGDSAHWDLESAGHLGPLLTASCLPKMPTSLLGAAEVQRDASKRGARIRWLVVSRPEAKQAPAAIADKA